MRYHSAAVPAINVNDLVTKFKFDNQNDRGAQFGNEYSL